LVARRKRLRIARQIGLRLRLTLLDEARLALAHERLIVAVIIEIVVRRTLRHARLLVVIGILLPELLLRRSDQAKVVFRVLIVVLGGNGIAGALRVARELDVFL